MDNKFDGVAFVEKLKELSGEEKQVTLAEKLAGFEDNCVQKASSWEKKLSGWNNGSSRLPTTEELLRISDLYGCSIDDLLGVSPRQKAESEATTYNLLSIVDAMVNAGIAKIVVDDVVNETEESMREVYRTERDIQYIKQCNIKIYNKQLIRLLGSYKQVADLAGQSDLNKKMCDAIFEHEKENGTLLSTLSSDDVTLFYKPLGVSNYFE